MFNLFNLLPGTSTPVMYAQNWHYVHDGLKRNLDKVIQYYNNHSMAVEADHVLVRLLQSIAVPKSIATDRYYVNVDKLALDLSMALRMTSPIYKGHTFKGDFYGKGCTEIIIADNTGFNPFEAAKNWKTLRPITVLRHPRSDLMLNLPDGKTNTSESGFVAIVINIPMLAMMYRGFRLQEEQLFLETGETERSVMQFVHMYALPSMLYSHLDYVIFNRIYNLERGYPMGESYLKHPFQLIDYSQKLTDVQTTILNNFKKIGASFVDVVKNVPCITAKDLEDALETPDMPPTRQVLWAMVVSRLPAVKFMLDIVEGGNNGGALNRNRLEVNRIIQAIRSYKSNALMQSLLPKKDYLAIKEELEDILTQVQGDPLLI